MSYGNKQKFETSFDALPGWALPLTNCGKNADSDESAKPAAMGCSVTS